MAASNYCGPPPEVRALLEKTAAIPITDRSAFDRNIAGFRLLRERYPDNLFVHESYQDAVQRYGIEGQLRVLTDEYQTLAAEHAGELMYRYLYARSLLGRGTFPAIQEMTEILAGNSEFAPAHRMLAEVYAAEVFRDAQKESAERQSFERLCPRTKLPEFAGTLPDKSPLINRAEQMLADGGDPDRIAESAGQGLKEDEWRLQRIRPFDWYSVLFKIQNQRDLQAEYWKVWSIQVRCYRKAGKLDKAAELLTSMDQRAVHLRAQPGNTYWDALAVLVHLYAEGNQKEPAEAKLEAMRNVLATHPDSDRAAQIDELGRFIQTRTTAKASP